MANDRGEQTGSGLAGPAGARLSGATDAQGLETLRLTGATGQISTQGMGGVPMATRVLSWFAVAAICLSTLLIVVVSAAGPSASVPSVPSPHGGPPWALSLHFTTTCVTVSLWIGLVLGCAGVVGVSRPSPGRPAAGARHHRVRFYRRRRADRAAARRVDDAISYAANGQMAVIGHIRT